MVVCCSSQILLPRVVKFEVTGFHIPDTPWGSCKFHHKRHAFRSSCSINPIGTPLALEQVLKIEGDPVRMPLACPLHDGHQRKKIYFFCPLNLHGAHDMFRKGITICGKNNNIMFHTSSSHSLLSRRCELPRFLLSDTDHCKK